MKAATTNQKKVLLVDDDPCIRHIVSAMLSEDYDVRCAGTVHEGLDLLLAEEPDLILLDLELPDRSGLEALEEIRTFNPMIPVVIQSGSSPETYMDAARRLGVDGFLPKPFRFDDLIQTVENCTALMHFAA